MAEAGNPTSSSTWQAPQPTLWERTKTYSSTAYSKALKPGFDKAYAVVDKLGAPVNRLSNKVGSEAFWPTTLDKESEKCARILRTFCKDGFYETIEKEAAQKAIDERQDPTERFVPKGQQRNVVKIPAKVIQDAVGLAIFTTMRTGWLLGGSGGAGVVVARNTETREWSPPSGIMTQNMSFGFLGGVDIFDTVLVINNYKALEAFTRLRCTLGTELGVVAGPVGVGGELDMELHKKPAPVWSYVKSRGFYAGIALAGNVVIERTDENAKFYGYEIKAAEILAGKARHPPERDYKILLDTLKAAQGDQIDETLLPSGQSPSDFEIDFSQGTFGVPSAEDDDPYGVKALEAEGLPIREAGTHQRPSAELFEFNPAPTSPIYKSYRKSIDGANMRRKADSWRNSTTSLSSVTRAAQTRDDNEPKTPNRGGSKPSSVENESPHRSITGSPLKEEPISEENGISHTNTKEEGELHGKHSESDKDDLSDIDSDAEIITAVSAAARPRVVQVAKPVPPALPPRNPGRSLQSPTYFTIKLKTAQNILEDRLALRTSVDNWTADRKGEFYDGEFHFKLDSNLFSTDFECKFVILPNRWMHDPNLSVSNPEPNREIRFTDSQVVFDPPTEEDTVDERSEKRTAESIRSDADDDAFVSVPHTPVEQDKPIERLNGA